MNFTLTRLDVASTIWGTLNNAEITAVLPRLLYFFFDSLDIWRKQFDSSQFSFDVFMASANRRIIML